ncbi:methylglutaconyl-CoA hydratase [Roseateles sp. YR242]|uniref:enoyl-CoA hydratase-related protein n=1 Tax=Roseateles sp. YR242 TaxID=1855305 RepID=UPI0008C3E814|nr:enoyl-CoA hydratase-related protein [Roseateles sp. YR242]SEL79545.1 methylglutaconyl-CoA hydratase [Roseateles sp. YR242]
METLQIATDARGVARVTMNRPEVFNAFNEAMIADLTEAFAQLGEDAAVRVIVLAGAGKAFSAGADIQWMKRAAEASQEWNLADARRFAAMLDGLARCPKPTIAQVHGVALGGGVGLTLACDLALATTTAQFAVSEARFGILPAVIGPYVVNAVGPRQARRLALTASRIDAQEALQLGLVQQVVAAEAMDTAVEAVVTDLLAGGPQAQTEIKRLLAQLAVGPITHQVRELTAQTIARVRTGPEARDGFTAFLAKQPAPWLPPSGEAP